mmetsp:Transcript_60119/g.143268  ORF Transcript_60119/g.143268 Transcript_60119/m.143268 type:complete len:93 (+) Transcript_60119:177-455(+)
MANARDHGVHALQLCWRHLIGSGLCIGSEDIAKDCLDNYSSFGCLTDWQTTGLFNLMQGLLPRTRLLRRPTSASRAEACYGCECCNVIYLVT